MARTHRLSCILALAGGIPALLQANSGTVLEESVALLNQWVETERMISREQAQWETNRAAMENLIAIHLQEMATLSGLIADAEEDTSAAERRRAELMEQDEAVKAIEAKVVTALIAAENQLKQLVPLLPPPLQDELRPPLNMLPADSAASRLSVAQRVQPIVAILTQIQKFNQVVTVVEGFREFEAGRTVQTESIYFGLGAAYYVDTANEHAGIGVLGSGGWSWKNEDSLVATVREFINIYRGTKQARYVKLPVSVQ